MRPGKMTLPTKGDVAMNEIRLSTLDGHTAFLPGDSAQFLVRWELDSEPEALELRLLWCTQGKGDRDQSVEDSVRWTRPGRAGEQTWEITLPGGPYSFSGKLISLQWLVEAEAIGARADRAKLELIVAPDGTEILLHSSTRDAST